MFSIMFSIMFSSIMFFLNIDFLNPSNEMTIMKKHGYLISLALTFLDLVDIYILIYLDIL